MKVVFLTHAWRDVLELRAANDPLFDRVVELIEACRRDPFCGIGKPEPLKGDLSGCWSRRIDREHRLVYRVIGAGEDQRIEIAQCRYHY
jgi:toxin YoeB